MNLSDKYKTITDIISNAQDRGEDIVNYINNMTTDLSNSEINEESIDRKKLENQITVTSNVVNKRHNLYTEQLLTFVLKLQKYIDSNYISVNRFLRDNSIKVLQTFADISEEVGYPIDDDNIWGRGVIS